MQLTPFVWPVPSAPHVCTQRLGKKHTSGGRAAFLDVAIQDLPCQSFACAPCHCVVAACTHMRDIAEVHDTRSVVQSELLLRKWCSSYMDSLV